MRRGKPGEILSDFLALSLSLIFCSVILVAHKIYGIPQTVNTANYVYFLAYKELFALRTDSPKTIPPRDLDALVTGTVFVDNIQKSSEKKNLFQTLKLNCFPYIAGKVKRSYGVTRFSVHLKRNISKWSTTVCTLTRIRR